MSNLLKDASILLTPTAYENGRMNAIKPYKDLYGPDIVVNGGFDTSSNWTIVSGSPTISGGKLNIVSSSDKVRQSLSTLNTSKVYKVEFTISNYTSGGALIKISNSATSATFSSNGTHTFFLSGMVNNALDIVGVSVGGTQPSFSIDNVSVVEDLSGDFTFSRGSAATRVNAQGLVENVQILSPELVSNGNFSQIGTEEVSNGDFSQEGSELVTNGDFATDSDWNLGAGQWTILNGFAVADNASNNLHTSNPVAPATGLQYKVTFTLQDVSQGYVRVGLSSLNSTQFNSDGTHTLYIESNGNRYLYFTPYGFTGKLTNVSVKEVGQNFTLGSGWSIGEDKAIFDGGADSNLFSTSSVTSGKAYKYSFTVSDMTTGALSFRVGSASTNDLRITEDGTYSGYTVADGGYILARAESGFNGSITNISVKEVGQDWTLGTGWSIGDGVVEANNTSSFISQSGLIEASKLYRLTFEARLKSGTNGTINAYIGGSNNQQFTIANTNWQSFTYEDTRGGSLADSIYFNNNGTELELDNISVKEITDDTDLPRINYEGFSYQDVLGSELVVNGNFATDSDWSKDSNWAISNGSASADGTSNNNISQASLIPTIGKTYKVVFEVLSISQGYFQARIGNELGVQANGIGVYTSYITATTNDRLRIYGKSLAIGSIDNVSVKEYLGQEVIPDSGCGSWLLEGQSTNLVTKSNLLTAISGGIVTPNAAISPDGTTNAIKVNFGTESNSGGVISVGGSSASASTEYTISFYAKNFSGDGTFRLRLDTDTQTALVNETFVATSEWVRYTHTFTTDATASSFSSSSRFRKSLTTDNNEVLFFGIQLEQQSYATSYIPTEGATNTRLQDIANNSGNSTLINSTEGVSYFETSAFNDIGSLRMITLQSADNSNRVSIGYANATDSVRVIIRANNSNVVNQNFTVSNLTDFNKFAFKYESGASSIYLNGSEVLDLSSANFTFSQELSKLNFDGGNGANPFYGKNKALAVYKEALTDANLRCLTYPNPVATTFDLDFDTIAEQFTFTRGSEATFVNEQGLIESTNQIGPELVVNGDFATDSDWILTSGASISNDKLNVNANAYDYFARQLNVSTIGKTYKVSVDVEIQSGRIILYLSDAGAIEVIDTSGSYTFYIVADGTQIRFRAFDTAFTGSIDNVSVKEVTTATNTPRIDYSTGEKAFLLEPQSTNYSINSEQPSTWHSSNGVIVTPNAAISPEGLQNSSLVVNNASSGSRYARNAFVFPSGSGLQTVTTSYFIKYYNNQWVRLKSIFFTGSPAADQSTYFDIQNGVLGTVGADHTAKMEDYGNGWYRCSITFDIDKSVDKGGYIHIEAMDGDNSNTYAAIGQGFYAYGSQGEELSYPTSYIPTGGAFATRNQELCNNATPVINSEEGTLYAEISALTNGGSTRTLSLNNGTSNVIVMIRYRSDTNQIQYLIKDGINADVGNSYTLTDATQYSKVALKYKSNDISFWVDGIEVSSSTSTISLLGLNDLSFDGSGTQNFFGNTKGLKYYPKALADVQLEDLTTI